MGATKTGINQAIQVERKRLLMDATISAIAQHGLSRLTLAKIAREAGLTAGSVNFHFSSKETLLLETLEFLTQEFQLSVDTALHAAGPEPAARLQALFDASLDPEITEPRKMAVWYAFAAEARGRADYQRICGAQDKNIFAITLQLCDELIRQGNKQRVMNPRAMANAVQGLIDEIGQEILYAGADYDREDARFISRSFLASVFPWAYSLPAATGENEEQLSTGNKSLRIVRADKAQLASASKLFDQYRQFYKRPADPKLARKFLGENLRRNRSIVFLALGDGNNALGFTQIYQSWCSVAAAPYWILYDLYVDPSARRRGVGKALMAQATAHARKSKACRIDLETAVDNYQAQALYESRGWVRDNEFYKYSLELD